MSLLYFVLPSSFSFYYHFFLFYFSSYVLCSIFPSCKCPSFFSPVHMSFPLFFFLMPFLQFFLCHLSFRHSFCSFFFILYLTFPSDFDRSSDFLSVIDYFEVITSNCGQTRRGESGAPGGENWNPHYVGAGPTLLASNWIEVIFA